MMNNVPDWNEVFYSYLVGMCFLAATLIVVGVCFAMYHNGVISADTLPRVVCGFPFMIAIPYVLWMVAYYRTQDGRS